jgi:hypothetical protein
MIDIFYIGVAEVTSVGCHLCRKLLDAGTAGRGSRADRREILRIKLLGKVGEGAS